MPSAATTAAAKGEQRSPARTDAEAGEGINTISAGAKKDAPAKTDQPAKGLGTLQDQV